MSVTSATSDALMQHHAALAVAEADLAGAAAEEEVARAVLDEAGREWLAARRALAGAFGHTPAAEDAQREQQAERVWVAARDAHQQALIMRNAADQRRANRLMAIRRLEADAATRAMESERARRRAATQVATRGRLAHLRAVIGQRLGTGPTHGEESPNG